MKRFRVTCLKATKILGSPGAVMQFTEQEYVTDKEKIEVMVSPGYAVVSIVEILPIVTQLSYEVEPFFKNEDSEIKWNDLKKRNYEGKHPLSS